VTIQTTVGVTCTITSTVISDHTYTQTLYDTKVLTSTEVVKDSEEVTVWVIEPSPIVRSTEVTEYHTLVVRSDSVFRSRLCFADIEHVTRQITDVDVSYYAETMPGTAITSVHKSKETVKATTTPCDTPSVIQSKPEPTPTYEPTTWSNATEEQPPQTSSASLTRDAWTHVTQSPAPESKPSTDLRPGWLPVDSASSGHCGSDGKQCHGAETTQVASESQTTSQVNVLTTLRSSPVTTSQAATSTTVLHEPHSAGHTVGVSTIGVALVVFLCSFLLVA
jgi:hypothetical protein